MLGCSIVASLVIVCIVMGPSMQGVNILAVPDEDKGPMKCTMALLRKYFHSGEALSGAVLAVSITTASLHTQKRLIQAMHEEAQYTWTVAVRNLKERTIQQAMVLHEKPQGYFMVIENLEADDIDDIFQQWKLSINWNPLAQFVVYLASLEPSEEEMTELMVEILLNFMSKRIYNINVIGQHEESTLFYGKTVFPYHPDNNCGYRAISVATLDTCSYCGSLSVESPADTPDDHENDGSHERDEGAAPSSDTPLNADSIPFNDVSYLESVFVSSTSQRLQQLRALNTSAELPSGDCNETASEAPLPDGQCEGYNMTEEFHNETGPCLYVEQLTRALFLDKFPKDLSGCPLVAAFRSWEPYIFHESNTNRTTGAIHIRKGEVAVEEQDTQKDVSESVPIGGIEYNLIQTIAAQLNIDIELRMELKNLFKLYQLLIDGEVELILGGIDEDPSISQFVSSTIPYQQDDLTWCVAKAKRTYNLLNFLGGFDLPSWLLILLFLWLASATILLIESCLNLGILNRHSFFNAQLQLAGVLLGQSIDIKAMSLTLRIVLGTLLFMALMFTNIYQSFMASTMTTPRLVHQISRVTEIYENRMQIKGSVDIVRNLDKNNEVFKYLRQQFEVCHEIEECLNSATEDERLAVAVSRQHYFFNSRVRREQLSCFDRNENIYIYMVTMLMPKKFHLLHKINPVVQHVIESGHMQKWARDVELKRRKYRSSEDGFKSLNLMQLAGTFIFAIVLLLLCIGMFLVELLVHWLIKRRGIRSKIVLRIHKSLST